MVHLPFWFAGTWLAYSPVTTGGVGRSCAVRGRFFGNVLTKNPSTILDAGAQQGRGSGGDSGQGVGLGCSAMGRGGLDVSAEGAESSGVLALDDFVFAAFSLTASAR